MFSTLTNKIYEFDDFRLIPAEGLLTHKNTPIDLNPKAFAVLATLVEHHGHLVSKADILDTVWDGAYIEEGSICKAVWFARNALGDSSKEKYIKTVPRRGYRFVAPVSVVDGSRDPAPADLPGSNGNGHGSRSVTGEPTTSGLSGFGTIVQNGGVKEGSPVFRIEEEVAHTSVHDDHRNDGDPNPLGTVYVVPNPRTKRRNGLVRGSKFLIWGLGVWFVFMVLVKTVNILGALFAQNEENLASRTANSTVEMMGSLLVTVAVPAGVGMFVGIGLFLFGGARMVYAFFEKEGPKKYTALIERVIVGLITIAILAIAVPNLIFSYREAGRAREINRISIGEKRSVAVLRLQPIDPAFRNELYEIGVADSLIQRLNSIKGLVVRPLSAVLKFAGEGQDALAAGRELKVDYVVASNYQMEEGRIKVTSQLLNVTSGKVEDTVNIAAESVDPLSAQDAIAKDIGQKVLSRFGSVSTEFRSRRGTNNEEAYRAYLYAVNIGEERGILNLQRSLEYLDRAVALDPNFALAWASKAHIHENIVGHTDANQQEQYQKSMDAIGRALTIDPNLSEAHSALCLNKYRYEYDVGGAETACKRAIELDPASSIARKTYAQFLYSRGRFPEAFAEIKTAIDLQPVSYRNQQIYALTLYYARRYEEAEEQFKSLIELNPNQSAFVHDRLVRVLDAEGKTPEAFELLMRSLTLQNTDPKQLERFKKAYRNDGWHGVVSEQIKISEAQSDPRYFQLACLHAKVGNKNKALDYLEKAYEVHSFQISVLPVEPQLDPLRGDARFADLVKRVYGE